MTQTITPERFVTKSGQEAEAVVAVDQDTIVELRASEWTEGHLALMSFPSAPAVAYVGAEPPLMMTGTILSVGQALVKGPGGDFEVLPAGAFEEGLAAGAELERARMDEVHASRSVRYEEREAKHRAEAAS